MEQSDQGHLAAPCGDVPSAFTVDAPLHTPGPWECRDVAGAGLGIYGSVRATMGDQFTELVEIFDTSACGEPRFQIAYERWVQFPRREWREMQRANAALIATSPELLDVLQTIVRQCGDRLTQASGNTALLEHAQHVIAKATGSAA